ncbi:MAG: hypothetical protein JXQ85_00355 [Cognatishimia sp.]|uniref:hypothetical protein n=1 Tax=Cognatishimia sp. TaxID=2211648 RepID=UPI003B8CABE3
MRYFLCSFVLLGLVACDSPSIEFMDGEKSVHEIGGHSFSVHVKGDRAQVIRTNFAKKPDIRVISRQAERAIEEAAHCPVTEIYGDVAVMVGQLDCSKPLKVGEWAKWTAPPRRSLICDGQSSPSRWGGWSDILLECY